MKSVYDTKIGEIDAAEYEQMFGWPKAQAPPFEVVLGDIFALEWADADMVFCNSTCFSGVMMENIYQKSL